MNIGSFVLIKNFAIIMVLNRLKIKSITNIIPKGFKIDLNTRIKALSLFVS